MTAVTRSGKRRLREAVTTKGATALATIFGKPRATRRRLATTKRSGPSVTAFSICLAVLFRR